LPQTRTGIDRDAKVDEILTVAARKLGEGGYDAMSIAAISRDLGLAQNSIYWYFGSKDELFVAAIRRLLGDLAAKKPPRGRGLEAQVLWASDRMNELAPLRAELRQRAARSAAVADFDAELNELLRRLLTQGLETHLAPDQRGTAAAALLATVEGALTMKLSRKERHRVISYALGRIIGGA